MAAGGSLLLAFAAVASVTAPAVLAAPQLEVTPSSGSPGASLTATATGFPEGPVTFRWDNSQLLGTVTAGPSGTAVLDFAISATAAAGTHYVRACASNKCPQGTIYADATVTVVPPPTPTPVPPTPTPVPTPVPTAVPTPVPTLVQTPAATLRPGQTPIPTPVATLPNGSPAPGAPGASASLEPSPIDTLLTSSPGTLAATQGATVEATDTPMPGAPAAGPTADSGLPGGAVPFVIGGLGVMALVGRFVARGRRRPGAAVVTATAPPNPSTALPTSWQIPADVSAADAAPAQPPPVRSAASEPRRQRTMVVHVTPKDPTAP